MQLRRLVAGGLIAASVIIVPLSSMASAEPKEGSGGTVYCYRPGDEVTKTNPYSPGSTYTDWSTTPPRTYKCGSDGKFTVLPLRGHGGTVIARAPGVTAVRRAL